MENKIVIGDEIYMIKEEQVYEYKCDKCDKERKVLIAVENKKNKIFHYFYPHICISCNNYMPKKEIYEIFPGIVIGISKFYYIVKTFLDGKECILYKTKEQLYKENDKLDVVELNFDRMIF